ncbi:MAG: DUF2087 domain-containing protein [Bacillota bacterium]
MFNITETDIQKVKDTLLISTNPLKLKLFPAKEKRKYILLGMVCLLFEKDKKYHESEMNEILKGVYEDYVTIRRYLIIYRFFDRTPNGSAYWLIANQNEFLSY